MHAMIHKSIPRFFDLFCCFIDDGVRMCVGPGKGFKFSVRRPQNCVLRHFQAERAV